MRRLILALSLIVLYSCGPVSPQVDFEEESQEPHSLEELLALHEKAVSAQGKDIYFIQPIGEFGKDGVQASLEHIAEKGESVSTYNNMELIFGVAVSAKQNTGYVMCDDSTAIARLQNLAYQGDVPSWQASKFDSALTAFCDAGAID